MPLQIRRGTTAEVNSITPLIGELIYDTELKRILIGDGSTAGGNSISGITNTEAKQSTYDALSAGTHRNITFTQDPVTKAISAATNDTIEADSIITSKIFNSSSSVIIDVDTGTFTGNLSGNVTGNLDGDVNGNLTGTHTGNVITNLISSSDSSTIIIDTTTQFQTTVVIDDNLTVAENVNIGKDLDVNSRLNINSSIAENTLRFNLSTDSDQGGGLVLRRSRGTANSPTTVINGDRLNSIVWTAYDGTTYQSVATIQARVTDTVSSGIVPTSLRFIVKDSIGDEVESLTINQFGNIVVYRNLLINGIDGDTNTTPLRLFNHHNSTTDACNMIFHRGRGTTAVPVAVENGDVIYDLQWNAYDGTNYTFAAGIRGRISNNVSSGVTPGRLDFRTADNTGSVATRVNLTSYRMTLNVMPVLPEFVDETAANAFVGTPTNGMMYYDSGAGKIKGYQGGAWVVLQP